MVVITLRPIKELLLDLYVLGMQQGTLSKESRMTPEHVRKLIEVYTNNIDTELRSQTEYSTMSDEELLDEAYALGIPLNDKTTAIRVLIEQKGLDYKSYLAEQGKLNVMEQELMDMQLLHSEFLEDQPRNND